MVKISVKNVARLAATAGLGMSLAFSVAPAVALAEEVVPTTEPTPVEGAENTTAVEEVSSAQELKDAVADSSVTSIMLTADIELSETLVISRSVTINGDGHSITGLDTFTAKKHLVSVQGISEGDTPVILTNLTLKTGSNNRHALNIWNSESSVELNNVTLDHTVCEASEGGAPLVINGTAVTVTGKLTTITGTNSWYAVNVDNKYGESSFEVDATNGATLEVAGPKTDVVAENTSDKAGADKDIPTVNLGYPEDQTITVKDDATGKTTIQRAVAHIGSDRKFASLEDAIGKAAAGDIIELYTNVETGKFTLSKAVTIDGNGFTITNTDAAGGSFVTVDTPGVTIKDVTLDGKDATHGVQFYKSTKGMLDGVTVNGGTGTSVLVNGSTVTIKNCTLNPGENAYANVEYCVGKNVTTIPGISFEGTLTLGDAAHGIWADKDTTSRIKDQLGAEATDRDVQKKLAESITNNTKTDVKLDAVLPGGGDAEITVPGEKPVTPPVETGHAVTVEKAEGGKVAVTPEKADKGETVTITATPDAGQEVRSVDVLDAAGKEVTVKAGSKVNTWTFTMPDGAVKVTVTFGCDGGALCPSNDFDDVDQDAWYHDVLDWAVEEGLLSGYDDGTMGLEATLSRGQLATVLWRRAGEPAATTGHAFSDCDPEAFYADAVAWAAEEGVIKGYGDGSVFGPNDPVTREQFATILWRLAGEPEAKGDLGAYPDAEDATAYAVDALAWAVEEGVLSGFGTGELAPTGMLSRAMLAAMLYRIDA